MTSRALLALGLAVVAASGVGAAALLDQQATTPAPASQTPAVPAVPAVPPVAPLPPAADEHHAVDFDFEYDFDFDFDFDMELAAVLADVETAVAQSVDADALRLGLGVRDVTADEARQAGLDGMAGTWVTGVVPESAAARAGLAEGDIIVRVDGQDVRSARHLTRLVSETPAGRTLPVEYLRAGQRTQVTVTPETAPRTMARVMREPLRMALGRTRGRLGVGVQDLSPQLAKYFAVDVGVLVTQVNDGSPAARGGMKAGDVITRIDTTPVARASDITRALATVESGATVTIALMRDRAAQSLTVTLDARPTRAPATTRPRGRTAAEQ